MYVDEDTADGILLKLLVKAGHDVVAPTGEGLSGTTDPRQLIHSIRTQRALLTHIYKDFKDLHDLIKASGGSHRGILVVRKDNDSTRDLTTRGIVNAIRKLEDSGQTIECEYQTLNHWR